MTASTANVSDAFHICLPDGREWPCTLRRSPRARRVRMRVDARGSVQLIVPQGKRLSRTAASDLAHGFAPWLQKTLCRLLGSEAQEPAVRELPALPIVITLPLTGNTWQVVVRAGQGGVHLTPCAAGEGGRLLLTGFVESPDFIPSCCSLLQGWLRSQAMGCLEDRIRWWAARMGVGVGRVSVRAQRSRWGSCSARGDISLNCLLMLLPVPLVDHVCIHELCHRQHMNHSPRYRAHLEHYAPQWAAHESALKLAWRTLPAWAVRG